MVLNLTLLGFAALAGAIHVLSPDHWLPASVYAWQRGWSSRRSVLFAILVLGLHTVSGFVLFVGFRFVLRQSAGIELAELPPGELFGFAVALVLVFTMVRGIRFGRLWTPSRLSLGVVLSLLGPCESIVPIFAKAQALGIGYLEPLAAFLAGTLLSGSALILFGKAIGIVRSLCRGGWIGPTVVGAGSRSPLASQWGLRSSSRAPEQIQV